VNRVNLICAKRNAGLRLNYQMNYNSRSLAFAVIQLSKIFQMKGGGNQRRDRAFPEGNVSLPLASLTWRC